MAEKTLEQKKIFTCPHCNKPLQTYTCIRTGVAKTVGIPCKCKKSQESAVLIPDGVKTT